MNISRFVFKVVAIFIFMTSMSFSESYDDSLFDDLVENYYSQLEKDRKEKIANPTIDGEKWNKVRGTKDKECKGWASEFHFIYWNGTCRNHKIHGRGTATYKMISLSGLGIKIIKQYVGEMRNGKFNGYGTLTWWNGSIYKGEWKNGKKDGYGIYIPNKNYEYKGEWKNDKQHGKGRVIVTINGKVERTNGIYKNGFLVKRIKSKITKESIFLAIGAAALAAAILSENDSSSSSSSSSSYSSGSSSYDARCYSRCKSNKNNVEASCQGLSRKYIDMLSTSTYYSACMKKARSAYKECEYSCR